MVHHGFNFLSKLIPARVTGTHDNTRRIILSSQYNAETGKIQDNQAKVLFGCACTYLNPRVLKWIGVDLN